MNSVLPSALIRADVHPPSSSPCPCARSRAAGTGRTPFDPWLVGAILLVTLVIAVLAFRRRRMLPVMTDL
jgi:hypothetical protein